jgi:glycosyltransferase involved in cell wall biosynthesis
VTSQPELRLAIVCPGVEHVGRGYETFARELYGRFGASGMETWLIKGSGETHGREHAVRCLRRTSRLNAAVAASVGRPTAAYELEAASFVPPMVRRLRHIDPHVVLTSDKPVAFGLSWARSLSRSRYRTLFSNGGPYRGPFPYADLVHHLTEDAMATSRAYGETDPRRARFIPNGFDFAPYAPPSREARRALRRSLSLPEGGPIVVAVGALDMHHKRHHQLAAAVSKLSDPTYLLLVGQATSETNALRARVDELLPDGGWEMRSVAPAEVPIHLRASDVYALASTIEGFPRAWAEAAAEGLPCIVHDFPAAHEVLGPWGTYVNMREIDAIVAALVAALDSTHESSAAKRACRQAAWAREQYSWDALLPRYEAMVRDTAALSPRSGWARPIRRRTPPLPP